MIDDLDRTLAEMLKQGLPASVAKQVAISFAPPDDKFPPASVTLPAIDLFLYDIRENQELRTREWEVSTVGGTIMKKRPPVRVDCSYMITAWASTASSTPAFDEHMLLGEVMKVLLRYPVIPDALLLGALKGQAPPMPTASLHPGQLQSISEFWQAMGGKPKAALSYMVTIGVEPTEPEEAGPPVVDKVLKFKQGLKEE